MENCIYLDYKRLVFITCLKSSVQIGTIFEHYPRMIHLRVTQITPVFTNKKTVGKIALLYLRVKLFHT